MAYNLIETTMTLLQAQVASDMPNRLAAVRALRTDQRVSTDPLHKVYLIEKPLGAEAPFVVLICPRAELPPENFTHGKLEVYASVVVEDTDRDLLQLKAWRYQAALYRLLHRLRLTSADNNVTLTVVVTEATFSPQYPNSEKPEAFRREVVLRCEVQHWEDDG